MEKTTQFRLTKEENKIMKYPLDFLQPSKTKITGTK